MALHELTLDQPLRAFVLFSSIAGVHRQRRAGQLRGGQHLPGRARQPLRRSRGLPGRLGRVGPVGNASGMGGGLSAADEARLARIGHSGAQRRAGPGAVRRRARRHRRAVAGRRLAAGTPQVCGPASRTARSSPAVLRGLVRATPRPRGRPPRPRPRAAAPRSPSGSAGLAEEAAREKITDARPGARGRGARARLGRGRRRRHAVQRARLRLADRGGLPQPPQRRRRSAAAGHGGVRPPERDPAWPSTCSASVVGEAPSVPDRLRAALAEVAGLLEAPELDAADRELAAASLQALLRATGAAPLSALEPDTPAAAARRGLRRGDLRVHRRTALVLSQKAGAGPQHRSRQGFFHGYRGQAPRIPQARDGRSGRRAPPAGRGRRRPAASRSRSSACPAGSPVRRRCRSTGGC